MKKPVVVLAILIAGLVLSGSGGGAISFADTNTFSNEITSATSNSSTSDEIYGLRIENINRNGADFYWSTSVATNGSVEYAYTKLAEQYNPQSSGSPPSVLINVAAKLVKSDSDWVRDHHIRVDNLDMYYNPFVEYTIKSATPGGEIYTLSGELVLVDTGAIPLSQTLWFNVSLALFVVFLGYIPLIRKHIKSRKAKKATVPLD